MPIKICSDAYLFRLGLFNEPEISLETHGSLLLILFFYRVPMFSHVSVHKDLFSFSIFAVDPFHVVNSLLSHSYCYFLHPRILRSSFSSSSRWTLPNFSR